MANREHTSTTSRIIAHLNRGNCMLILPERVSDHFTYKEVIRSDTAEQFNIDNNIKDEVVLEKAKLTAKHILEPVRDKFGPLVPNSWYRGEELEFIICRNPFIHFVEAGWGRKYTDPLHGDFTLADLDGHKELTDAWTKYFAKKQHPKGMSVDFEYAHVDNRALFNWCKENLDYDQLILEFYRRKNGSSSGWVHCSYNPDGNRRQAFEI